MANTLSEIPKKNKKLEMVTLFLLSLSFLLSDWIIYLFTFSDFVIAFLILLLAFQGITLKRKDSIGYLVIEGYILLNSFANYLLNENFLIKIAGTNIVKIFFYHTFAILMYRYIYQRKLRKPLLIYLNIAAVGAIIIGLYITFNLMTESNLPYEFLWTFTRSDIMSYMYRGSNTLVRTRSVFSEPAHFGYFLNIVLSLNFFSKIRSKALNWSNGVIIGGILITFSYASIGVMTIMLIIKFIQLLREYSIKKISKNIILVVTLLAILIFIFRNLLYESLVVRTRDIIEGRDGSYIYRIMYSWKYINRDNIFLGNGLGHTPPIQNIYAYMLSDLGLIAFLGSILASLYMVVLNSGLGLIFIAHGFQKGGYLSSLFWLYLLLLAVYIDKDKLIANLSFYNFKKY